jgi:hypothetical protein
VIIKYAPFWHTVRFITGKCISQLDLVLKVCTSEFILNKSLFLTTNIIKKIYTESKMVRSTVP